MKREEVRAFIKSGVDALSPSIKFNSGRITEFNSHRSNDYPYIWLESLNVTANRTVSGLPVQTWAIVLHIAKLDKSDSTPEQYEALVDECDYIGQQLWIQYDHTLSDSVTMSIETGTREPFIHRHADNTSGVIFSFELTDYNPTNVC